MVTVETKKSKNKDASDYYFDFVSSNIRCSVLRTWSLRFQLSKTKSFVRVRLCARACVCAFVCACVSMCVCAYVCMYVRTYVNM